MLSIIKPALNKDTQVKSQEERYTILTLIKRKLKELLNFTKKTSKKIIRDKDWHYIMIKK